MRERDPMTLLFFMSNGGFWGFILPAVFTKNDETTAPAAYHRGVNNGHGFICHRTRTYTLHEQSLTFAAFVEFSAEAILLLRMLVKNRERESRLNFREFSSAELDIITGTTRRSRRTV